MVSVFYFEKEAIAKGLVNVLKELFTTFRVAENLTSDDGSQFRAHDTHEFLTRWGIEHRVSAAYNPKRMLISSIKSYGSLNWDHVARALLQHRNTPIKGLGLSPAQLLFGRRIKDLLPIKGGNYKPVET